MKEDLIAETLGCSRDEEISTSSITYLDHAGCPLPGKGLLQAVFNDLQSQVYANPHSVGGIISTRTDSVLENTRKHILSFIHADQEEYEVIFTAGATASVKLIVDIIDWKKDPFHFIYPQNIHTSLLSIRNYVNTWDYLPVDSLFETNSSQSSQPDRESNNGYNNLFFAVPAECNMSGAKLQMNKLFPILEKYRNRCHDRFYWLLDIAKYVATSELNMNEWFPQPETRPDFMVLSFYKIFGYPTGIGALIVKKEALPHLNKRYFGGGTLVSGATDIEFMVSRPKTSAKHYEDGTINFHGITALRHGFHYLEKLGGIKTIQSYCFDLMRYLLEQMRSLVHQPTYKPLCIIYSYNNLAKLTTDVQGPTITFNLQYADGEPVGFNDVGHLCTEENIQIRTGCFCNIGGCQYFLQISGLENEEFYHLGRVCSDNNEIDVINHRQTGACRISLGFGSTKNDCDRFLLFLSNHFLHQVKQNPLIQLVNSSSSKLLLLNSSASTCTEASEDSLYWHHVIYHYPRLSKNSLPNPPIRHTGGSQSSVVLAAIFVYPIKSCAGVRVDDWPLTKKGLKYDRHFAIINDQGKVVTQKQFPMLALVQPSFHVDVLDGKSFLTLHITAPATTTALMVRLDPIGMKKGVISEKENEGKSVEFSICGRKVFGQNLSHDANQWFTDFLNQASDKSQIEESSKRKEMKFYLVQYAEEGDVAVPNSAVQEECKEAVKKDTINETLNNSFANSAQFLLLSLESITALIELIRESKKQQKRLEKSPDEVEHEEMSKEELHIKVENFRPNLIVRTSSLTKDPLSSQPHQEDHWKSLSIPLNNTSTSLVKLDVTGPCSRCSMVNVNGSTGIMNCKVFEALADYRKVNRHIYFGQFLTIRSFETGEAMGIVGESDDEEEMRLYVGSEITTSLL